MLRYTDIRDGALDLFPGLADIARRSGSGVTTDRLAATERRLREGRLRVVVCGEFKRGKSSLVNGLLGEIELLPESPAPATSVVTTVGYGPAERIEVQVASDGTTEARVVGRGELRSYVTERENPRNIRGVRSVTIEISNDQLKSGLVLVDTPGIGGSHTTHLMATEAILDTANVIVFVADTTAALSEQELQFLRDAAETARVLDDDDAIVLVLNKADKLADDGQFVADTRAALASALGRPAASVVVVPVSSKARKKYLRTASGTQRDRSNFAQLEELIWATLGRRQARLLADGPLAELDASAVALQQPIDNQIAALDAPQWSASLRRTVEARHEHLRMMAGMNAPWREDLAVGVTRIEREVRAGVVLEAAEFWARLGDDLGKVIDTPGGLSDRIARNLLLIVSVADRMLKQAGDGLLRELTERHGLEPGQADMTRLPAPDMPDIRVRDAPPTPVPHGLKRYASLLSITETSGAVLGKLIDALMPVQGPAERLGGPVGSVVGAAVAGSFLLTERLRADLARYQERKERIGQAEAELKRISAQVERWIARMTATASRQFGDQIGTELEALIVRDLASAAESLRRLDAGDPADPASVTALRQELVAERLPLVRIRERIATLAQAAAELAARGSNA